MINYAKLDQMISDSGLKKEALAKMLGITGKSLRNKLNGTTSFKDVELDLLKKILHMDNDDFLAIFFKHQVADTATLNKGVKA